jgi:hypothetical protein
MPPDPPAGIPRTSWAKFKREVVDAMEPGDHCCLMGPTKRGKSTMAAQLLKPRPYVVVLDAKGGDDTVNGYGYELQHEWPIPDERRRLESGKPIRVCLRPKSTSRDRLREAHDLFARCIEQALTTGFWTIYVDELRLTSEGRTIDLGPEIEVAYMTGRGRKVSMIAATQAPRWVPKAAFDQATHQFHWPIPDEDGWKRQAEISGIGRQRFMELTAGLGSPETRNDALYVFPPDTALRVKAPAVKAPPKAQAQAGTLKAPDRPRGGSRARSALWGK